MASLDRDHRRVAAGQQILRGAIAKVARVLHVKRNRIGAAQLVADVLRHGGHLDPERSQACRDLRLEDLADIHFGDAEVAVSVVFDLVKPAELL